MKQNIFHEVGPLFTSQCHILRGTQWPFKSLQGSVNNEWHPAESAAFNCWDKAAHAAAT